MCLPHLWLDTSHLRELIFKHNFQNLLNVQSWTNILEEGKDTKQNYTGAENFGNIFCVIFNLYYNNFFLKDD